ncbi:VOC family protein [Halovenus sp. WSH3]|uniref:VOC family protein n=1 Tax=Halovenus carboxidivorans TaxID=2692199 RepID=A0A6B0T2U6_9EURY|nr:VOC family protein [Halovenus carboxidivorans]MXR52578.1 VOC family protein [Halovenus carboxidivorans]
MTGIVFFRTDQRRRIVEFYTERLGFEEWLEQDGGCTILQRDNLLVGFCDDDRPETEGVVTVVVEDRAAVEELYGSLEPRARGPPETNADFDIYQFFADDPDGRAVEVQTFLHETPPVS